MYFRFVHAAGRQSGAGSQPGIFVLQRLPQRAFGRHVRICRRGFIGRLPNSQDWSDDIPICNRVQGLHRVGPLERIGAVQAVDGEGNGFAVTQRADRSQRIGSVALGNIVQRVDQQLCAIVLPEQGICLLPQSMVVQCFCYTIQGIGADAVRPGADRKSFECQKRTLLECRIVERLYRALEAGEADGANRRGDGLAHRTILVAQGVHQGLGRAWIIHVRERRSGCAPHRGLGIVKRRFSGTVSCAVAPLAKGFERLDPRFRVVGSRHFQELPLSPLMRPRSQQRGRRRGANGRHRVVEQRLHVHGEIGAALGQSPQSRNRLCTHLRFRVGKAVHDVVPRRRHVQARERGQHGDSDVDLSVGKRVHQRRSRFRHVQIAEDVCRNAAHRRIRVRHPRDGHIHRRRVLSKAAEGTFFVAENLRATGAQCVHQRTQICLASPVYGEQGETGSDCADDVQLIRLQ